MTIRIINPTQAQLVGYESKESYLRGLLTYTDKRVVFELDRMKRQAHWLSEQLGEERYQERLTELKQKRRQCLLNTDPDLGLWVHSGLAHKIAAACQDSVERAYTLPEGKIFPWAKIPGGEDRPYQHQAVDKLVEGALKGPCAVSLATGLGKAQPLSELVLTSSGWRQIGSLVAGDDVIGADGRPTLVTGVYPQGPRPVSLVVCSDGASVLADMDHLWSVTTDSQSSRNGPWRTMTTRQIKDSVQYPSGRVRWRIPLVEVQGEQVDLPIDPYVLGVLIGDGCLASRQSGPTFTTVDDEIAQAVSQRLPAGFRLVKDTYPERAPTYRISRPRGKGVGSSPSFVLKALRELGLWGHLANSKFLPAVYKTAPLPQRRELLMGLMDTDGWTGTVTQYTTVSRRLADDVVDLVRSLGGTARLTSKEPSFVYKGERRPGQIAFNVTIKVPFTPFLLRRKIDAYCSVERTSPCRKIVSVEDAGNVECVCIRVAAEDQLYVTRDYIVTHNTRIQMLLAKRLGLKTVVMTPSKSIARQTLEIFKTHLGAAKVGLYGDGRKDFKKQVVVAIDDSLSRVEPGTDAWEALSGAQVFIADESHLTPANTLKKTCLGLLAKAPYRFFFSGTQLRTDGLELVLESIIGPVVMDMSVREGVEQGYLSQPLFTMFEVESSDDYSSPDLIKMTRKHFFYNQAILAKTAELVNKSVGLLKHPTVVLIEEVEQFTRLLPMLSVGPVGFAHGPLDKENLAKVPEAHRKSDPVGLVKAFNAGEIQVLIGTSCISTGTDIQPASLIVRLKGKAAEIPVRQDVGRGTRRQGAKKSFHFIDFDLVNVDDLHRHALERKAIYEDIFGPVREVRL